MSVWSSLPSIDTREILGCETVSLANLSDNVIAFLAGLFFGTMGESSTVTVILGAAIGDACFLIVDVNTAACWTSEIKCNF